MEFTSQICTTEEQSKRLLALGLKKETADCAHCYTTEEHGEYKFWDIVISDWEPYWDVDDENIPAWSLHRLMEIVPFNLKDKRGYIYNFVIEDNNTISYYYFAEQFWHCNIYWGKSNLYDNFIDCIEWLIKEGYFNKEYLKE